MDRTWNRGKYIKCACCGKKVYFAPWKIKQGRKFCSQSCYGKWRTKTLIGSAHPTFNRTLIKCEICGKEFWIKKYEKEKGRKFCSYECYYQWMTGRKGEKTNGWQGGISFEPYTSEFNKQLKELIRQRDEYKCQLCGMAEIENIEKLSIHHIDYIKKNCLPDNLIALCRSCNAKVNSNRKNWKKYFQEILTVNQKKLTCAVGPEE